MERISIKKNFMYNMTYQILAMILPFITSPYVSRVIGADGLGIFSYSSSVASYFVLFSMLGINNYGNRAIARTRDDDKKLSEVFSNITFLHILISIICCTIYVCYIFILTGNNRMYAAIQSFYVLSALFDISWFYFGIEQFKLTVTRNIVIKILTVIFIFTFVRSADDLWIYCLIMSVGYLISQLTLWLPIKKYVSFVKPELCKMRPHIKPLITLFIPAIAVSLYKYMDKIMIGTLSSTAQLGYYENAEKVINMPLTIITAFGTVMLPKMSNLVVTKNKKESEKYIMTSMEFVMCLAFALAFGLAGVGTIFAPIFWGSEFILSGYLIMGLAVTIPFISFANVIRTQYLIPNALDREYLSSVVAGAVVNVVINALLIKTYGAGGAVVGTIAAEGIVCIWQCWVVRKELPMRMLLRKAIPFLPMGVIMFWLVIMIGFKDGSNISTLVLQVIVGGLLYTVMCGAYFIKTKNEVVLRMLNKYLKHDCR